MYKGVKSAVPEWWEYGHFYHIFVRSFQDSNGDGIGDLIGINSRLSYLQEIGVDGVWLSPINPSPLKDAGYDISDYLDIHSDYGTMKDFEKLIKRSRDFDIKLLMDFVPNHTSDRHIWFQISTNPNHPKFEKYKNYYIWHEGKVLQNGTRVPPNNWCRYSIYHLILNCNNQFVLNLFHGIIQFIYCIVYLNQLEVHGRGLTAERRIISINFYANNQI